MSQKSDARCVCRRGRDPEEYVRHKFQGKDVSYDKTVLPDGTIVFDIVTSQIKQRCSFTEI